MHTLDKLVNYIIALVILGIFSLCMCSNCHVYYYYYHCHTHIVITTHCTLSLSPLIFTNPTKHVITTHIYPPPRTRTQTRSLPHPPQAGGIVMGLYTSWKLSMVAFTALGPIMYIIAVYAKWSRKINWCDYVRRRVAFSEMRLCEVPFVWCVVSYDS